MIGYLFLGIAVISTTVKGYCGKKTSGYTKTYTDTTLANLLRMVICIVIGLILVVTQNNLSYLAPSASLLGVSALSGIATASLVITWLTSVKRGAYMMLDAFQTLGAAIPLILCYFLFDEQIKVTQWIGFFILIFAVVIMCSYNNSIKEKLSPLSILLLIVVGASNGLVSFSQKLFIKNVQGVPISVFNFYTYVFAAIVLLIFFLIFKKIEKEESSKSEKKPSIFYVYVTLMATLLFSYSYFLTSAAGYLDSAILYPLNQGGTLILTSLMSAIFFREKLTLKAIVGIILMFLGLIIINVL